MNMELEGFSTFGSSEKVKKQENLLDAVIVVTG